jgi:hypothetical protein
VIAEGRAATAASVDTVSAATYSGDLAYSVKQVADSAGGMIGSWLTTLKLEPDSIKDWLGRFGDTLLQITERRRKLIIEAGNVTAHVQLGLFEPSQQIKAKMADRLGPAEGGLAWALDSVVLRLSEIHEALRQSLAAQLNTDLESAKIIDKVRDALN